MYLVVDRVFTFKAQVSTHLSHDPYPPQSSADPIPNTGRLFAQLLKRVAHLLILRLTFYILCHSLLYLVKNAESRDRERRDARTYRDARTPTALRNLSRYRENPERRVTVSRHSVLERAQPPPSCSSCCAAGRPRTIAATVTAAPESRLLLKQRSCQLHAASVATAGVCGLACAGSACVPWPVAPTTPPG